MRIAKPFIKWVGGKGQLIPQLEALLPTGFDTWQDVTYIEPFIGGGAMLFHMLQNHKNIKSIVINDINPDLTTCYKTVRDNPGELLEALEQVQAEYYSQKTEEHRKEYFLDKRDAFNTKTLSSIENTTLFIFLNRTCFNGLYRVNKSGKFNVPFGKYTAPTICDKATIMADSKLLQEVEIMTGDFELTFSKAKHNTFFYFDPPYRPISNTSNFNDYTKESFNDMSQIRLKEFCDKIDNAGYTFMLSNSDRLGTEYNDAFFDILYKDYQIERVMAKRNINSIASKRGKLSEIVVSNYAANKYTSRGLEPAQQLSLAL